MASESNLTNLTLRAMPEDVRKIILLEQMKEKEKRGINQFSIGLTIYKIVREWERCYNSQKTKK